MPFKLNQKIMGWFALALCNEVKCGQSKLGYFMGEPYTLKRLAHDRLLLNNESKFIKEQNDIIFVWYHPLGLAPTWLIPSLDMIGWSSFLHHRLKANTHPQEVYENSLDISHFSVVHSFHDISVLSGPNFNQHNLTIRHCIRRRKPNSLSRKLVSANFEVSLHGLGCAYNHIHVPDLNLQVRMLALTTPIKPGEVEIRLAVAIANSQMSAFNKLLLPLLHRIIHKNIVHDFYQDLKIWENKCYQPKPLLVKGDGQIVKFRQWCNQFYV